MEQHKIIKKQDATTRDRSYFRFEHQGSGPLLAITSVWFERRGKGRQVSVSYKLFTGELYRTPRSLSDWLDDKDELFIKKELDGWRDRVNLAADYSSVHFPDFFLRQRTDFLRWLHRGGAKPSTIEGYLYNLGRFVFPFFVMKLRLEGPVKWSSSYPDWENHLFNRTSALHSRNRAKTALRRYLRFLEAKGHLQNPPTPRNENFRRMRREGSVLPGELPEWQHVHDWIASLPPGRCRWVLTMCAAFGVRVSEALATKPEDLIGSDHLEQVQKTNDVVRKAVQSDVACAFLNVNEAKKKKIYDVHVLRTLGETDEDPKTGPYIACCTAMPLAELIESMLVSGEFEGDVNYDAVYGFLREQTNVDETYPFSEYSTHDFRRLHITLQTFEFQSFFLVAQLHGHSSEDTTKKYYQWGLARRQRKANVMFRPIRPKSPET